MKMSRAGDCSTSTSLTSFGDASCYLDESSFLSSPHIQDAGSDTTMRLDEGSSIDLIANPATPTTTTSDEGIITLNSRSDMMDQIEKENASMSWMNRSYNQIYEESNAHSRHPAHVNGYDQSRPCGSRPIRCPAPQPESCDPISTSQRIESDWIYNQATWRMYHRIMNFKNARRDLIHNSRPMDGTALQEYDLNRNYCYNPHLGESDDMHGIAVTDVESEVEEDDGVFDLEM